MHCYQQLSSVQRRFGPPNLKMMFVCGQCWRNGQLSEADKNKKYCSAKARHTWVLQKSLTCELWTGGELTRQRVQYNTYTNWGPVFVSQVGERQAGGACKFPWKEKVDNSQTTSNQKTHPVSVRGTCPTFSHFYPKIDCFLTETNFHQCLPNDFSSSDLHARDSWQKVSVHRELHVCSQRRRKRPLDLHEGKQQWVCQGDWLRSLVEFN